MQWAVKELEGQHPDPTLRHLRGYSRILPEDQRIMGTRANAIRKMNKATRQGH
jgi:hypothetical protein